MTRNTAFEEPLSDHQHSLNGPEFISNVVCAWAYARSGNRNTLRKKIKELGLRGPLGEEGEEALEEGKT